MTKVISVISTKGGVGKTTLAKYMAVLAVKNNKKTLLIDLCQNVDIATQFGYNRENFEFTVKNWMTNECSFEEVVHFDEETGVDLIVSNRYVDKIEDYVQQEYFDTRFALKEKLEEIPVHYDYIFIDTHPSETNLMIVLPLSASDLVLVPCRLNYSSVVATERTIALIEKAKKSGLDIKYKVVTMAMDTIKMQKELADFNDYMKELGVLSSPVVRHSVIVDKLSFRAEELSKNNNKYAKKVMDTFKDVYAEIEEVLQ